MVYGIDGMYGMYGIYGIYGIVWCMRGMVYDTHGMIYRMVMVDHTYMVMAHHVVCYVVCYDHVCVMSHYTISSYHTIWRVW